MENEKGDRSFVYPVMFFLLRGKQKRIYKKIFDFINNIFDSKFGKTFDPRSIISMPRMP